MTPKKKKYLDNYQKEHISISLKRDVWLLLKSIAAQKSYELKKRITPSDVITEMLDNIKL